METETETVEYCILCAADESYRALTGVSVTFDINGVDRIVETPFTKMLRLSLYMS